MQAASAYGAMPCADNMHGDEPHAATQMSNAHDVHRGHGSHEPAADDTEDTSMSCCDDDGASACIASGHCLSATPLLPVPTLNPRRPN